MSNRHLGVPTVPLDRDRGQLSLLPALIALVFQALLHRRLGEWYLTLPKATGAVLLLRAFDWLGGPASNFLDLLTLAFIIAVIAHRWGMLQGTEPTQTLSSGDSFLDPAFTSLREAWSTPPALLRPLLADNTLLYVSVEPGLLACLSLFLLRGGDYAGGWCVAAGAVSLFWHAVKIKVAARRTIAAARDVPLHQRGLLDQVWGGPAVPTVRPAVTQLVTPLVSRPAAVSSPPADIADLTAQQKLRRMAGTVASSLKPLDPPAPDPGTDAPGERQVS